MVYNFFKISENITLEINPKILKLKQLELGKNPKILDPGARLLKKHKGRIQKYN